AGLLGQARARSGEVRRGDGDTAAAGSEPLRRGGAEPGAAGDGATGVVERGGGDAARGVVAEPEAGAFGAAPDAREPGRPVRARGGRELGGAGSGAAAAADPAPHLPLSA